MFMHVGACAFAPVDVHMHRATFEFTYIQCACINRTVCSCVNKAVCECVNGTTACGYAQYRLICVDIIRDLRMHCKLCQQV